MVILEGKKVAENILADLREKISQEKAAPKLAVILIGENKASYIYVNLKEKKAKEIGVGFELFRFEKDVEENEVIKKIGEINRDESVHGLIIQLPLPQELDVQRIINEITPEKDVDGFHPDSIRKFKEGEEIFWPVFPGAIVRLLESSGENFSGKKTIAVVNSEKFGEVMKSALEKKDMSADYVLYGAISEDLSRIKEADVIITAIGQPNGLTADMVKEGAVVIDGGITEEQKRVLGDVDFDSVKEVASFISPVPGGVGPVTIACLLENTYKAYKMQNRMRC